MRVSNIIFLFTAAILFSSMAFAYSNWSMSNYLGEGFDEKGELQPYYQSNIAVANAQLQQAPEFIRGALLNERIQGKILMENGDTELVGIELSKEGIQHVFRGEISNPTLEITGNESAVVEILNSDAPVDAAVKAINGGKISYGSFSGDASNEVKGESTFALTTKLFFVNIASFMSGFLQNVYIALS